LAASGTTLPAGGSLYAASTTSPAEARIQLGVAAVETRAEEAAADHRHHAEEARGALGGAHEEALEVRHVLGAERDLALLFLVVRRRDRGDQP
jgi:hypothetical protein